MEREEFQPPIHMVIDVSNIVGNNGVEETNIVSKTSQSTILTRLHAGYFRISLSLGSQALLWKSLSDQINSQSSNNSHEISQVFRFLPSAAFSLLWWLGFVSQSLLSLVYILRCLFHFHMVKAELLHHIGHNYLYAPWISWLLLLQSNNIISPTSLTHLVLFWVFSVPVFALDVKIYGQWFTTKKRFLSTLANPTSHMSVIANLVVAQVAAEMGWKETAIFMFSLGIVHYLVLFITLYQQLSGFSQLPSTLRPVFFLFFAAPSIASLAWCSISGSYHIFSKMLFFLSLFLFASLACRPAMFKKSMRKVNVAWWAYSFPVTSIALASVEYAKEVKGRIPSGLTLMLSTLSVFVIVGLMGLLVLNPDKLLNENDPVMSFSKDLKPRLEKT